MADTEQASSLSIWLKRPTRSRGRAAIARLTSNGRKFAAKLAQVSREREARLFKDFGTADKERLNALLHQLSRALDCAEWDH